MGLQEILLINDNLSLGDPLKILEIKGERAYDIAQRVTVLLSSPFVYILFLFPG